MTVSNFETRVLDKINFYEKLSDKINFTFYKIFIPGSGNTATVPGNSF